MKKKTIQKIAKDVVQFEINALKDLKKGFRMLIGYSDKVLPPKKS